MSPRRLLRHALLGVVSPLHKSQLPPQRRAFRGVYATASSTLSTCLTPLLYQRDDLSKSTLSRFYREYVRFVEAHLEEEERDLFSVIEGGNSASLSRFDDIVVPHTDIDDRTNDIASLIFKCLPERASTALRCAMLSDIYALRDDLRRHNDVEMYLLRPMIEKFISSK